MESELIEKDLKNQIERLGKIDTSFNKKEFEDKIYRLEEELRNKERSYQVLYTEFEKYKAEAPSKKDDKDNNNDHLKIMETLIGHLKDESANQNRASMDLLASMMGKMENKKSTPERKDKTFEEQYHQLSSENYQLKLEIAELKRERSSSPKAVTPNLLVEGMGFAQKIKELERVCF